MTSGSQHLRTLLRSVLLAVVIVGGFVSILATNGRDCTAELGESCTEWSDCCLGICEGGRCCRDVGGDLSPDTPASECCSGQINDIGHGPYCCATAGMVVGAADRCCSGLVRDFETGQCYDPCPAGCYWEHGPVTHDAGDQCVCPGNGTGATPGTGVTPPGPRACSPCNVTEPNCYVYRAYEEGYWDSALGTGCRGIGPFYAPNQRAAEQCAREAAVRLGYEGWTLEAYSGLEPLNPCRR